MRKFYLRFRSMLKVVRKTLRQDYLRWYLSSRDRLLKTQPDQFRVAFIGSDLIPTRTIPARHHPLIDPWEYQRQLDERIRDVFASSNIPFVNIPHVAGGPSKLGIREQDWFQALVKLRLVDGLDFIAAMRRPGRQTGELEYIPIENSHKLHHESCVALLAPAATVAKGKVVKRYGFDQAVVAEKWTEQEAGFLESPYWNPVASILETERWKGSEETSVDPSPFEVPHLFENTFDIDVVYTWVDGTDPDWLRRKRAAIERVSNEPLTENAAADLRFIDHDELRYSLRSLEQYAPWVRHVWIVTDRQIPSWLNIENSRVTIVDHTEIAPEGTNLPTFNSHAIEANLHRIEGLSEHFLYLNDDMFFSSFVSPGLFFSANGIAHVFLSRARVGSGEATPAENASDAAGKNARKLVLEASGRRISRKLYHAPYALQRSVSYEIEARWPRHVAETRNAQLRTINDITLAGSLHLNYAFATGRAVGRSIRYRYVNIGRATAAQDLDGLYRDRFTLQTFCLNEADEELDPVTIDKNVRTFLQRRFPDKSTFEL